MQAPKFHICNFNRNLIVAMNVEMGRRLYDLVGEHGDPASKVDVALLEKLRTQFYFMGELTQEPVVTTAPVEESVPATV